MTDTQTNDVIENIDPIAVLVPHYKVNNRQISERLGFKAQSLLLPSDPDTKQMEGEEAKVSNIQREVWILRDAQDYVWYRGHRVVTQGNNLFQIEPASSEAELWDLHNADYYHDLSLTFVLLKELLGHSLRIIDHNGESIWELSYRFNPNTPTIIQTHQFLTILITDAFLKYTTIKIQEMIQNNVVKEE